MNIAMTMPIGNQKSTRSLHARISCVMFYHCTSMKMKIDSNAGQKQTRAVSNTRCAPVLPHFENIINWQAIARRQLVIVPSPPRISLSQPQINAKSTQVNLKSTPSRAKSTSSQPRIKCYHQPSRISPKSIQVSPESRYRSQPQSRH